jgi:gamma-glutamylcyclotransferase (GGCT)/AIG2-like uncharacterized protein YtfP
MSADSEYLFVYGTLQPGGPFYEAISGRVRGHRRGCVGGVLVDVGRYPALLEGEGWVSGVLLEVAPEALALTDRIEGTVSERAACEYLRIRVDVHEDLPAGGDGARDRDKPVKIGEAWTYLYAHPSRLANRPRLRVGVAGGRDVYAWPVASSTLGAGSWRDRLRSMP